MENLTCYCIISENNNRTYVGATNNFDKRITFSIGTLVFLSLFLKPPAAMSSKNEGFAEEF